MNRLRDFFTRFRRDVPETLEGHDAEPSVPEPVVAKRPRRAGFDAPKAADRLVAVQGSGTEALADEKIRFALFRALVDPDQDVGAAAAAELDAHLPQWSNDFASEAARAIASRFGMGHDEVARRGLGFLETIGPPAIEPLLERMESSSIEMEMVWAARALGTICELTDGELVRIAAFLDHKTFALREEIARTIDARAGGAAVILPQLSRALLDESAAVRQACATAIGRSGPVAAAYAPRVACLLADTVEVVRDAAVDALVALGEDAAPALVELLAERSATRTREKQEVMGDFAAWVRTSTRFPQPFKDPLESSRNVEHYLRSLEKRSPEPMFCAAVAALGRIRPRDVVVRDLLVGLSKEDLNPQLRAVAVDALGDLAALAQSALTTVASLLLDPDPEIRVATQRALPKIDPDWARRDAGRDAIRDVVSQLHDSSYHSHCAAVCQLAGAESVPFLLEAAKTAGRVARQEALHILGKLGGQAEATLPELRRIESDAELNAHVRERARGAIRAIEEALG